MDDAPRRDFLIGEIEGILHVCENLFAAFFVRVANGQDIAPFNFVPYLLMKQNARGHIDRVV